MSMGHDASGASNGDRSARELAEQVRFLESEITDLRRIYRIQRWEFWLSMVCMPCFAPACSAE